MAISCNTIKSKNLKLASKLNYFDHDHQYLKRLILEKQTLRCGFILQVRFAFRISNGAGQYLFVHGCYRLPSRALWHFAFWIGIVLVFFFYWLSVVVFAFDMSPEAEILGGNELATPSNGSVRLVCKNHYLLYYCSKCVPRLLSNVKVQDKNWWTTHDDCHPNGDLVVCFW